MGLFDKKKSGKTAAESKLLEIISRAFDADTFQEVEYEGGAHRWGVREGSTLVEIWVNTDYGSEEDPIAVVSSLCAVDTRDDDKLYRFLIESEEQSIFTNWTVVPGNMSGTVTVFVSCNLSLNTLDDEEIQRAAFAVAQTSDKLDDEIVKRFGGKRAQEFLGWN